MPEKDIVSMILVADELINRRKIDCYFVLVGESKDLSYDDKLKKLLIEKRLEQRVFFTGKRNNLQNIYVDFNLFLMTSLQEGFPNSLLEAMAMGVASVVTSIDGIPEIIKNKESGILVKPKDILGITDEIELLLNDTNLREAIAAKARNIVETDLSFERRLRKMEDQYEALMVGN
jgi:glycosyltransferase involved in cell wall biosynthesis